MKIAIVGGGPGGLITARLLEKKYGSLCRVTIFEASSRTGGKIQTRTFNAFPAGYEAGVAECYDYSHLGSDPLRELVTELGLNTVRTAGETVVLDGLVLGGKEAIRQHYGEPVLQAIRDFYQSAARMLPLQIWRDGHWQDDNSHPWTHRSCEEILEQEVNDPVARRYLRVAAHSDLATEPHLTNGVNGLKTS